MIDKDKMIEKLLGHYREVKHEDAPHIFNAIEELASHPSAGEKAKFGKVFVLKDQLFNPPMLEYLAGCAHYKGENVLVLGTKIMKDLGVESLDKPVSQEFKAVLAHEMGHAFHGDVHGGGAKMWSNLSPLIGLIGGVAGAYLVKKIIEKHPNDSDKQQEELKKSEDLLGGVKHGSLGAAATVGLYTAGVGLGLTSGLYVTKAINHKVEFRADAYSKELMGDGKPMADALARISKSFAKIKGVSLPTNATDTEVVSALDKARNFIEKMLHPPMMQRIEALAR